MRSAAALPAPRLKGTAVRAVALAILLAATAACGGGTETHWFNAGAINRADGVVLVWSRIRAKRPIRMPMDHGPATIDEQADYSAFATLAGRNGRFRSSRLRMDYRWTIDQDERFKYPDYLVAGDRVIAYLCWGTPISIAADRLHCDARHEVFRQIGGRAERIHLEGDKLIFGAGLGGPEPCGVSLEPLGGDVLRPFSRTRHYVDGPTAEAEARLAISYLAPRSAWLVDYGATDMPIYEAGCAGLRRAGFLLRSPALREFIGQRSFREFVEVVDIVPTADPDDPALLLTWRDDDEEGGFSQVYAVLRPKGALRILPGPVEEQLGMDGGLCQCTGFWAGDPELLLLDLVAHGESGRADIAFELFDLRSSKLLTRRTSYGLD